MPRVPLMPRDAARPTALLVAVLVAAACTSVPGLGNLPGREVCWEDAHDLEAVTIEGVLDIDPAGARLRTTDGRLIEVGFARYSMSIPNAGPARVEDESGEAVAMEGERVLLFGGLAAGDRMFRVCEIDARQPTAP